MVQAARSGVQNIAEGSQASATSKKTELKLTQVARASLEELKLDYEDFLRQRGFPMLEPNHPALMRFKARKPKTVDEFATWVTEERGKSIDKQGQTGTITDTLTATDYKGSATVGERPCQSLLSACLASGDPITEGLIWEIHRKPVEDVRGGKADPVNYRRIQNYVADSSNGKVIYTPPSAVEVPIMMSEMVK
jgi:hypothetical protein